MIYQSTRNDNIKMNSVEAVLKGIADDGGLFMLKSFDGITLDYGKMLNKSTTEIAEAVFGTLFDDFTPSEIHTMVTAAYKNKFSTPELTPTVKVGDRFVCELFHGPTSAFKDVALSMLPQFMSMARKKQGEQAETLILTATSGDTGKAALEGFRDAEGIKIIVFYPESGVSAVQRAQMVTQEGGNVCVCAVKGNFDDAQTAVKKAFADYAENPIEGIKLSSANSINIGRLVPQIVYYFKSYIDLVNMGEIKAGDKINFCVPTGNFGNILAGYFAKCLGLPVEKLICASNSNNVLTDFINTGRYDRMRPFYKTLSPSMDILVSSNLERLLFLLSGGNAEKVKGLMTKLNENGSYSVDEEMLAALRETFVAGFCDDKQTLNEIGKVYSECGYLCDTHTAIAYAVSRTVDNGLKTVVLSTASPYKFPVAVLSALGEKPANNEFMVMEQLNRVSGVKIPANLTGLDKKAVLHTDVTTKEDITDYVVKKAGEKQWKK